MKKQFIKPAIPVLCAGLLCTPVYATNIPETTAIYMSEHERDVYQRMIEESAEAKEESSEAETSESAGETNADNPEIIETETEEETGTDLTGNNSEQPSENAETAASETETVDEVTQENNEDMISMVETQSGVDADGFVTMNISVAENVTLPATVTMKSEDGAFSFTVTYQEQPVKLKPGDYRLTKVVDGSGQELDSGANLSIPEKNGEVYLDFTKPEEEKEENLFSKFVITNLIFIPIAGALWLLYQWWLKHH